MLKKIYLSHSVLVTTLLLLAMVADLSASEFLTSRPAYAGVWVNTFGKDEPLTPYSDLIAGEADRIRWGRIEVTEGDFDFSELQATLTRCRDRGYYYYAEVWTAHKPPEWVYDDVDKVITNNNSGPNEFPYYLDPDYAPKVTRFFDALATFIADLPLDLRARIAFLQPGFGSTGDRQLYKGDPVDSAYNISRAEYVAFMQQMTIAWHAAFDARPETKNFKFLWNIDDQSGPQEQKDYASWMYQNFNAQFRKQQFTIAIGYMSNDEVSQDNSLRDNFYGLGASPRWEGNPEFVRGELNDSKWSETPMAQQALKWNYYWTAISSIDRGLDAWETKPDYITTGDYNEAYAFSTRHSYYKRAATSPLAFVALRDVLDYSDGSRFSSQDYGSVSQGNQSRIDAILAEYAPYGALNEDSAAVRSRNGSDYILNSNGLNDVVWKVIDRNYRRHMSQINPNMTSVGRWRVGSTDDPYGRFARAFESSSGKNSMLFKFDEDFFSGSPDSVTLKVIYYDEVAESTWDLRYDAGPGPLKTALSVTGVGDLTWKTVTVTVDDAVMDGNGPDGEDLALINTDGLDDTFHLIEVERTLPMTLDAGQDQVIDLGDVASLSASLVDDGQPDFATRQWTVEDKPEGSSVLITNPDVILTNVSFDQAGTYVLKITADDTVNTVSDTLSVTVGSVENTAPDVDAGSDQSVAINSTASLGTASVTDDGLPDPPAQVTTSWSQASGPGTASFADSSAVNTTVSFDQQGTYVLELSADDGELTANDQVTIEVSGPAQFLFRDGFGDGDIATATSPGDLNGGFTPGSADDDSDGDPALPYESGGSVVLDSSSNGGFPRVFLNGLNAFDVGDGSTPVTWAVDVASWTNTDDQSDGKLHLSIGPNAGNPTGATFDKNPGEGIYIHFNTALTQYQLMIGDGSSRDILYSGNINTVSNFTDGFSFEVTVDDSGWSFALTGAGGDNVSTSGDWATHTFDSIFTASSYINVFQRDQGAQNDDIVVLIDSIEVTGAAPQFEDYETWSEGFAGLTDTDPARDFDGAGIPTGMERVLGGDPADSGDDGAIAPTYELGSDPQGKFIYVFRRSDDAEADPETTIEARYSYDLNDWMTATHQGSEADEVTITVEDDGFGPGIDRVTVAVPAIGVGHDRLFIRLRVTQGLP